MFSQFLTVTQWLSFWSCRDVMQGRDLQSEDMLKMWFRSLLQDISVPFIDEGWILKSLKTFQLVPNWKSCANSWMPETCWRRLSVQSLDGTAQWSRNTVYLPLQNPFCYSQFSLPFLLLFPCFYTCLSGCCFFLHSALSEEEKTLLRAGLITNFNEPVNQVGKREWHVAE